MFYERLKRICEMQGTSITNVVRAVGGSVGSVDGWKKGRTPVSDIVARLAAHLDTSTDFLLGCTADPSPVSPNMRTLDTDELRLFEGLRRADPPVRAAVIRMAEAALTTSTLPLAVGAQPAGPSFLSVNDEMVRPKRREKAACGLKRVEGNAAAGAPITAVPEDDLMASVPVKYMSDRYFIVRAKGDSMINADINDGDFCIFQKDAYLDEGNIMLVQVDGAGEEPDVTIKRVFFRGEQVELRAENPAYDPMFYPSADVRLMGVLVSVVTPEVDAGSER